MKERSKMAVDNKKIQAALIMQQEQLERTLIRGNVCMDWQEDMVQTENENIERLREEREDYELQRQMANSKKGDKSASRTLNKWARSDGRVTESPTHSFIGPKSKKQYETSLGRNRSLRSVKEMEDHAKKMQQKLQLELEHKLNEKLKASQRMEKDKIELEDMTERINELKDHLRLHEDIEGTNSGIVTMIESSDEFTD